MSELKNVTFYKKKAGLAKKANHQILGNVACKKYFIVENLEQYLSLIKNTKEQGNAVNFFEHTPATVPVNLFFDIEIKKNDNLEDYNKHQEIVAIVKSNTKEFFAKQGLTCKFQILESHETKSSHEKASYHIIVKLKDENGNFKYIKNISVAKKIAKHLFPELTSKKIVDLQVYADRVFRTIYSSKEGQQRPLICCKEMCDEPFSEIDCFVTYCPNASPSNYINFEELENKASNNVMSDASLEPNVTDVNLKENVSKILDSVHPKRYTDRNFWLSIGYTLKGISPSLKCEWHRFSQKWRSYNRDEVEATWNSINITEKITIDKLRQILAKDIKDIIGNINNDSYNIIKASKNCIKLYPKHHNNCLVNACVIHENQISCINYNPKTNNVFCCCSECGEFRPTEGFQRLMLQQINVIITTESKEENALGKVKKILLDNAEKNLLKKSRDGIIYRPINELSYAYKPDIKIFEWAQNVLKDNEDAASHQNVLENVTKLLSQMRFSQFDFIEKDMDYVGFKNGIYNLVKCQFTGTCDIKENIIVRKYFDVEFDGSRETPLTDKILNDQFNEFEGVSEFIYMMIGRLFHQVKALDNWECMMYLMGLPGTGKSTIMNIIMEIVSDENVGSISVGFEKTFGLSSLYKKDIIVIDDLPKNIEEVFPQSTFQSCISGNIVNIAVKNSNAISEKWKVPMIWGGNWYPSYIDIGQVTRRMICADFNKKISNPDTSVFKKIKKLEVAALIHKTSMLYKEYIEKHGEKSIWDFCPAYFKKQQYDMKLDRNPLLRFLVENEKIECKFGEITPLSVIREMFSRYIGKAIRTLDHGTFLEADESWKITKIAICTSCRKKHIKGCCERYSHTGKTTQPVVHNLYIHE